MVDFKDIQALADRIAKHFNPERIILFGSYAVGTAGPDSDVDLLVVLPFEGKNFRKSTLCSAPTFWQDVLMILNGAIVTATH
jgi:predicted nucleotidyltransferase